MDYDADSLWPRNRTGRDSEVRNLHRPGKVVEVCVDKSRVACRVQWLDRDGLISRPLNVKQFGSRSTSAFWCPKVGDDVSVTMDPNSNSQGVIDGSFYNTGNPPPITDPNTRHITFADGTVMEYAEATAARQSGQLTITSQYPISITCGVCTITASSATIKAGQITLDGPVHITGDLTVDGQTNMHLAIANPHCQNTDGSGGGT